MLCARQIPLGPGWYENGRQWGLGAESRCRQLVAAALVGWPLLGHQALQAWKGALSPPPDCVFAYFILKVVGFKCLHLANQYVWSYKEIYSIITGLVKW